MAEKKTLNETADLAIRSIFEGGQRVKDEDGTELERARLQEVIQAKKYLQAEANKTNGSRRKAKRIIARF